MIRDLERARRDLIRIDLTYRARKFKVLLLRTHTESSEMPFYPADWCMCSPSVKSLSFAMPALSKSRRQPLPPCEEAHWGRRDVEGHPSEQPPQNTTDPSNPRAVRMHLKHLAAWTLK